MTYTAERLVLEERAAAFEGMKPILEKLTRGERLSVEDQADFDARNADITAKDAEIKVYAEARALAAASVSAVPETPEADAVDSQFRTYLRNGQVGTELRAAGEATNSAGGYLVPPGWWQRLQVALKAFGGIANDFTQLDTESGQSMVWATVDPTSTVGTLLSENTQVSAVDYTFGQGTLGAYMYTSGAQLVSFQLANDSAFDIDGFISARVGESLGRAKANADIAGTGSSQPLGVVTALGAKGAAGVVGGTIAQTGGYLTLKTANSVTTLGGSTTELAGNVLSFQTILGMIASVDPAYRALGSKFYLNDMQGINMRSVVDSYGHPLWNPNVQVGGNDALYGFPVVVDNNIPNLAASTAGGPMFGHLPSAMVCRTVTQSGLLRLSERYADYLQIGFIGYMRFDIRANDLRAAVVVKPFTS